MTGEIKVIKFIKVLCATIACGSLTGTLMAAGNDAATPDEVVLKVRSAAKYLNAKGPYGCVAFTIAPGPWTWKESEVVGVACRKERRFAQPSRPGLVGRTITPIQASSPKL